MAEESTLTKSAGPRSLGAPYPDASTLLKGTVDELGRALAANQVIGEPMVFGDITVIPLMSVGLGFGAGGGGGGGSDSKGQDGEGGGGGGVGGVGVKPIAVVIIDANGARLEAIPEPASGLEKLGSALASAMEARREKSASDG